jgi:hypothetical protein
MDKIPGADVRWLLKLLLLNARLKLCLFARIGDYRPCLRFHYSCPLAVFSSSFFVVPVSKQLPKPAANVIPRTTPRVCLVSPSPAMPELHRGS